jgi:hypothetical protein
VTESRLNRRHMMSPEAAGRMFIRGDFEEAIGEEAIHAVRETVPHFADTELRRELE